MIAAERGELGGSVQIVQAGQNMKQFVVVLLIEIHIDSSLATIRKPSTKNFRETTLSLPNKRCENLRIFHIGNMVHLYIENSSEMAHYEFL